MRRPLSYTSVIVYSVPDLRSHNSYLVINNLFSFKQSELENKRKYPLLEGESTTIKI